MNINREQLPFCGQSTLVWERAITSSVAITAFLISGLGSAIPTTKHGDLLMETAQQVEMKRVGQLTVFPFTTSRSMGELLQSNTVHLYQHTPVAHRKIVLGAEVD